MVECVSGKLVYRGAEDVSNKPPERLICQDCYAQVGKGISLSYTKLERPKNLTAKYNQHPQQRKEKFCPVLSKVKAQMYQGTP